MITLIKILHNLYVGIIMFLALSILDSFGKAYIDHVNHSKEYWILNDR